MGADGKPNIFGALAVAGVVGGAAVPSLLAALPYETQPWFAACCYYTIMVIAPVAVLGVKLLKERK